MKEKSREKTKLKICEALDERQRMEDEIITVFFGESKMRAEGKRKFANMYKTMVENIKNLSENKLKEIHESIKGLKGTIAI